MPQWPALSRGSAGLPPAGASAILPRRNKRHRPAPSGGQAAKALSMAQLAQQTASVAAAHEAARKLQAAGNLDEAKRIYGQILIAIPHHAESLSMLASIAYQQGQDAQAEAYVDRAIGIYQEVLRSMPRNINVRGPLVNLLLARDRTGEAHELCEGLLVPLNPIRASADEFVRRRTASVARNLPLMILNTLPKSASESIWNRLAEGLGMAQSHLSIGLFPDCSLLPARVQSAAEGGLIAKEHIPASPYNLGVLANSGVKRLVYHVRDPRQSALSWAHFVRDDVSMRLMAPIWRKVVPPRALLEGEFSALLDWCIDRYLAIQIAFIADWMAVAEARESDLEVTFLSFERFIADPDGYLGDVLDFYDIDRAGFARDAEAEVVHLRKGSLDEWREVYSAEQQSRAWSMIPKAMAERFGWQA